MMTEDAYHALLLAKGIAAIEDYKRHPEKYRTNEELEAYLEKLIRQKKGDAP